MKGIVEGLDTLNQTLFRGIPSFRQVFGWGGQTPPSCRNSWMAGWHPRNTCRQPHESI